MFISSNDPPHMTLLINSIVFSFFSVLSIVLSSAQLYAVLQSSSAYSPVAYVYTYVVSVFELPILLIITCQTYLGLLAQWLQNYKTSIMMFLISIFWYAMFILVCIFSIGNVEASPYCSHDKFNEHMQMCQLVSFLAVLQFLQSVLYTGLIITILFFLQFAWNEYTEIPLMRRSPPSYDAIE